MSNPRRLKRRSQVTDQSGNVKVSMVKTFQVNKKKYKPDEMTKDILEAQKKARANKKYKKYLNMLKIEVKTSSNVMNLLEVIKSWGINRNDIFTFLSSCENEKLSKIDFEKVRFSDDDLKRKLTQINQLKMKNQNGKTREAKNPLHSFSNLIFLNKWLNDAGSKHLLNLSHRDTIWVTPVCDNDATKTLAQIISRNHIDILRFNMLRLISSWWFQLFPVSEPPKNYGNNPDYHQSQNVYVALDCEWKNGEAKERKGGKSPVSERDLDNVLSFQLSAYSPDTAQKSNLTVNNDTGEHFQWSELLRGILNVLAPVANVNEDGTIPRHFKVTLLTFFGGVDTSCFAGFETKLHDLMVLHKNFIFSSRYLPFNVRDDQLKASRAPGQSNAENEFKLSLRFVDVGLIAPQGGLSALGQAVGIPKIDTEQWDAEDHQEKGYYKQHMDVLRDKRPNDYLAYAQLDAVITLEYYLQAISVPFFQVWATKPPATIGSFGASLVFQTLKKDEISAREMIFNSNLNSGDIANSKGVMGVKVGQADLFKMAIEAYFGGFNVAFTSGLYNGRIIDVDATSAYNVAGLLLNRINFDKHHYLVLDDIKLKDFFLDEPILLTDNNDFKVLYELLKPNPFVTGVVKVQIDFPDNVDFTITPFQSDNKDYGPCYVKHGTTTIPLLDAFNAMRMGASVKLIDGYIPAQDSKGLSAFGKVQGDCLRYRNVAKAKKKDAKAEGDERGYYSAETEQLLFKLLANSIYGKTGQGTSSSKRARDFDTYDTEEISYSSITNPLIASQYTSITRYIVSLIFESVKAVCDEVIPLNITTDGYTFALPVGADFKENEIRQHFLNLVPELYKVRCAEHFDGVVSGFEVKGDVTTKAFNLKTRVNGTVGFDDSNGGIQALASMRGHNNDEIYDLVLNRQYQVRNKEFRMTNITELKHHIKNHYGHMETWEQNKLVSLNYDFSYRPHKFIDDSNGNRYLTTLPFSTVQQHDEYKKLGMMLGRALPIATCEDNFKAFIDTMNSQNLSIRKTDLNDSNFSSYVIKNYLAMNQDKLTSAEIYNISDVYNLSRSTVRNYLSRHKPADDNINLLAGWYFENINKFDICKVKY